MAVVFWAGGHDKCVSSMFAVSFFNLTCTASAGNNEKKKKDIFTSRVRSTGFYSIVLCDLKQNNNKKNFFKKFSQHKLIKLKTTEWVKPAFFFASPRSSQF